VDGNPYDILQVKWGADRQAIDAAYDRLYDSYEPQAQAGDEDAIATLEQLKTGRLASPALTAALLSTFAGVALFVTLAGIAGVIGTAVSQRTREFGLRMALGATRMSVIRLVLQHGAIMVLIGIGLGIGGAWAFGRLLQTQLSLFATAPTDPVAYAAVALIFLAAALISIAGPARRATTIDPLRALRTE
jgi:putative ABC transport system permease protein